VENASERQTPVPAITADEVAEARQFFPMDKFFIFGHARSGTTLLTRLIRLHPDVHCNYQAHFFTRKPLLKSMVDTPEMEEWLTRRSNRWNRGGDLSAVVLRAAADFILERDARKAGKHIVGDKSPNSLLNGQSVTNLHALYPDARLIFIVRDGRDAALSHRLQSFVDAVQHLNRTDLRIRADFGRDARPFFEGKRSLFTRKGIHQAAENWVRNVNQTHTLGQQLYGECYLALRFEDLVAQPWETMEKIWQFLGADTSSSSLPEILAQELTRNPDADWQRQKESDLAASIKKGKSGSWRELFTSSNKQVFWEIAGETLQEWGYQP